MDNIVICDECMERASFLDRDPTEAGAPSVPRSGSGVSLFSEVYSSKASQITSYKSLGAFAKWRRATISSVTSACPSA